MIIIDADACPAKDAIIKLAGECGVRVLLVASFAHRMPEMDGVIVRYTDCSPQAVDMVIMNEATPGDIVITQDYGLAAVVLAKKVKAVSPRGMLYTTENIDGLLEMRNAHARIRRGGGKIKGPAAFEKEDLVRLLKVLRFLLKPT